MNKIIVDVREPYEFAGRHIKGAINIPISKMTSGLDKLKDVPKDAEIVAYCNSGSRSAYAVEILKKNGYNNAVNGVNITNLHDRYDIE